MSIKDLEPKVVWGNFYGLTQVPRPSKHEEKVIEYLLQWGKDHNVEVMKDETGNVIFRAPATPGFENRRGVILQGHMDMVPQKTSDSDHNFLTDPIKAYVDGDWVTADRTTLGADNGMGVAMGLAVLEDFLSMYRLAVMYAVSGWNGAKLFANSSEFTNSLQSNSSGSSV